ncbi:MAG: tandem-95 repeat protein [Methylomicrobium sp.]
MSNFPKPSDKRTASIRKRVLSGLVALLAASPLMADKIYVATKTGGKVGSLEFKNEDILQFDSVKNEWSILFDGSDVGLAEERIDGFYVAEDYVLLSLVGAAKLNIGGEKIRVHGSDIVRFNWDPESSPGDGDTKGTFELFFDGSDVGVKRNIDALTLDQEGRLVFSLNGKNKLPQAQGQFFQVYRQDLVRFIGNTGPETSGYFELLFDGRKAGLNRVAEDIDGVNLGGEFLYLTTRGNFNVGGATGRNEDILRCDFPSMPIVSLPVQACSNPQVIFNGSDVGLVLEKLQDIQIVLSIDVALSPSTVAENKPAATAVGTFATSNTDAADTINYTLAAGAGDTDNALFQISGNQLQTTASFDFEAKSSYSIRVHSDVSDGRFFEKQFTITVQDANDAPTNLELSSASVNENQALGTVVGSFTTIDPDSGDTHAYTLVTGDGDTDNAAFEIVGNELKTAAVLDFETKNSYSIRVRSTDNGGLPFEKSLTITVGNGTDAPTAITLAPDTIAENKPSGTVVGDLASTDFDAGDTHTYTLIAGAGDTDNAAFQISGSQLKAAAVFDFETKNSYSIRVRSTDSGSRTFEKTLSVAVTDANDAPSMTAGGILNYSENDPATAVDPGLIVADVDSANLSGATVLISGNFQSGQDVLEFSAQNGITGIYDSGAGVLTLTGSATRANYQAALRSVKYLNVSDKPNTTDRAVTWTVNDGAADSNGVTSTIHVTAVNDTPVITGQSDVNLSLSEDTPREIALADLVVTDPDNAYPAGFTLTVGDGANYTRVGNTITPAANYTGSLTVPVVVNDGTNNSNSFNLTVTVTAVNDAPVITDLAGDTLAYSQNEPARVIDQGDNAGASDVDSTDFDTGTLTISLVNGVAAEDELGIRNQGDAAGQMGSDGVNVKYEGVVIGSFAGGTEGVDLVVTFNANADAGVVSALLRNITYRNNNVVSPDINNRTARFVLTDGDGATSIDADATITISPNDPPELTASGTSPSFTEDGGAVVLDSGLTVTDANDTDLESAAVTIANLLNTGNETLAADTTGTSITASYSAPTLTLTGTDTVAHYQQVLRSVTYSNGSQNPDPTARSIDFKVNDGSIDSNMVTTTLTVVSVNDAPSLTAANPPAVLEDAGPQTVNNWATFNAGTTEESGQTVVSYTVNNVSNPGLFSTPPAVAADGTLTYTPAGNVSGTSTFEVVVQDNGGTSNGGVNTSTTQTFTITVDSVNDAPSFTVGSNPEVNEDAGAVTVNGWATAISAGPGENGQTVGFVIDGNDNPALFSVGPAVASNGTLTFTPAPNMNGVAQISLHAQDDGGTSNGGDDTSNTVNFTITVNAVNDPPQVTAPGPFTATGNVSVSVSAPGLLTTVSDPADGAGASPFTVENASYASAQGGNVTVDTNTGAFTYNPPAGYEGADSFTYKVCDSGVGLPASVCTSATVNFTVSGMVWFIDNTAAGGGDGRLSSPFNTLTAFQAVNDGTGNHPATSDNIFLYESASAYIGPVTLLNNQKLLGQDATAELATMAGITLAPNSAALPVSNSANGTIVSITSATDAIRISQGASNTLRGFTIGNVTASGTGINMASGAFDTLTVSDVAINTNGRALNLAGGTLNATFSGITSTGGANNINLTGIAGTSNFGSGALSGATGTAFNINGGTGTISYGGTIAMANTAQRPVAVASKTGGTVTFSGAITANTGPTLPLGIALTSNAGATINFTGGLALSTGANPAFAATGGGTVNVTGTNSITTTTGTALNVANTTIGASGLTFRSINVDGDDFNPANGIILNNTGSNGGLTVTGTGSAGSGGTIRDTAGDGISLNSTERFTIDGMNITSNLGNGIGGTTVNGFDLDQVSITDNGDSAADDDSGIDLANLTGSAAAGARPTRITNSTISNNHEFQLQITNSTATLTDLQMSSNAISSTGASGVIGNLFNFLGAGGGSANMKLTLTSGTFTGNAPSTATGVQCDHSGTSGTMTCNISGATFTNNNVGPQASVAGGAQVVFDFNGNTVTGNRSHGINVFADANPPFTKSLIGRIQNNIVGTLGVANSGANLGNGIRIQNEGAVPVTLLISGNTVQEVTSFPGINANIGLAGIATGGEATNLTITNNTVREMDGSRAVVVQDNQTTAPDFPSICVDMSGNSFSNIAGQAGDGSFVRLRELNGVFNVRQLAPSTSAVVNELDDANSGNDPTGTKYAIGGTPQFNSGACTQP